MKRSGISIFSVNNRTHRGVGFASCCCFIRSILILLICAGGQVLRSQEIRSTQVLQVTPYGVEEGVSQSTVSDILQDSKGLLWLTTGGGVQYFDGESFHSILQPEESAYSTSLNGVRRIWETGPGTFLLEAANSIFRLKSSTGQITRIVGDQSRFAVLLSSASDAEPLCWMVPGGLFRISGDKLVAVRMEFKAGNRMPARVLPLNSVRTGTGSVVVAAEEGYLVLNASSRAGDTVRNATWFPFGSGSNYVCADHGGNPFLLSNGSIYSIDPAGRTKEVVKTGVPEAQAFYIDRTGHYWVPDPLKKRVLKFEKGLATEMVFVTGDGKKSDTLRTVVRLIREDRRGNLWFGTDGNGLLYSEKEPRRFHLSLIGFTRCIAYLNGEVWAGTFNKGLWRLSPDLQLRERINPAVLTDDLYFFDLFTDPSGRIWAATSKGVFVLNRKGSVVAFFPFTTNAASFLNTETEGYLLSTYDRLYRCGTGLTPCLTSVREQTQVSDIISFAGSFWTGSHYGVFRTDGSRGILESLFFFDNNRILEQPVYCLLPVGTEVWAGTDRGIVRFAKSGKQLPQPDYLKEITKEIVYSMQSDSSGRIWFGGNRGLGLILPEDHRFIRFTGLNNLQSLEFNSNAIFYGPGGWMWFGGINGINGVRTGNFLNTAAPPTVALLSLTASDSIRAFVTYPSDTVIAIDWHNPQVSGTVFSPDYLPRGTTSFSFFLEGYDHQWSSPAGDHRFSYRDLSPGKYRLWAKCIDSYNSSGPARCLLQIVIRPPFWKTPGFIIGSILALLVLIALIIRKIQEIKYRRLLKEMEHHSAIDRERLRISQDMHDEIGASLTHISILSEIVRQKQGDVAETTKLIDRISGISGSLVDDMGEIIWAINPKNDNLTSFTAYLRRHASEYLSAAAIEGELEFQEEVPTVLMTSEQRRNVYLVAKEALHNVVKHSGASQVRMVLRFEGGRLLVSIDDNGKGFDPDRSGDRGNGLSGMRKRMDDIGGSFSIHAFPGKGTRVEFSVILTGSKTT